MQDGKVEKKEAPGSLSVLPSVLPGGSPPTKCVPHHPPTCIIGVPPSLHPHIWVASRVHREEQRAPPWLSPISPPGEAVLGGLAPSEILHPNI